MVAISYMAGSIYREEAQRFKRMVFRSTRGKALSYFEDLSPEGLVDYAGLQDKKLRSSFVIVFQEGQSIRSKLTKICESF